MRIIAGKHKGRKIETPRENSVRPTSDFAREGIFNILAHGKLVPEGSAVENARVLDLFCGTGAFGLEAISRGASHATFIDQSRDALELARASATKFNELAHVDFLCRDAAQLPKNAAAPYTLAFLDPPYSKPLLAPALPRLNELNWLAPGAVVIAEHDARSPFALPPGYEQLDRRQYGRATVEILRKA